MSGDQPVTRYEFETYKQSQRDLRKADLERVGRVATDVESLEERLDDEMDRLAEQREADQSARQQTKRHDLEWTWQLRLTVVGIAVALAGVYAEILAIHH